MTRQIKNILSFLIVCLLFNGLLFAQVPEWVARYNGPAAGSDRATAIATDAEGNVYVTGRSGPTHGSYNSSDDYITIKYGVSRNPVWIARYNGPGNGGDEATAIVTDAKGHVYVTGRSWGGQITREDYATIKYDADGNPIWVARYNGPENGTDEAAAMAIDAEGNVYVTGRSWGGATNFDYATIKYNAAGNQVWAARYNGPGNGLDEATAIALDADGNVYVTGRSWGGPITFDDYATIKYDAAGNQLWVARYNGVRNGWDEAKAMAIDAEGYVYVTGGSDGEYATIKYDPEGNELWVARYNGPGNYFNEAKAIALDAEGHVYVTGRSWGGFLNLDYATIKYDAEGSTLWVARYNGPGNGDDEAAALALDAHGNVYVTGRSWGNGTNYDYATIKYDAAGNPVWEARYNGPGNWFDEAAAIAVDDEGNVYVTGADWDRITVDDYATIKYDAAGNEVWIARYSGPGSSADVATAIALDAEGNVYVTGKSAVLRGTATWDYATIKYTATGNLVWVARYREPGDQNHEAAAIAVDDQGSVYVTGRSVGVGSGYDYATIKYDAEGYEVWVARYNGPGNGADEAAAIAVDNKGYVYVTGKSIGVSTYYEYATIKYDAEGNQVWVARYNVPGSGGDAATAIAVDAKGYVHVTGRSGGFYATIKYDAEGNQVWVARYNGPGNNADEANALALDAEGNVYVTGGSWGIGTFRDYATIKYDAAGNTLWVARYDGPGHNHDDANAIAVDADGNVYVTGKSWGGADTGNDYATIKYNATGNPVWIARYNGTLEDEAKAIALDSQGNVYVTGSSSTNFGMESVYATVKYNAAGNQVWVARYNGPVTGRNNANALAIDADGNVFVTGGSWAGEYWRDDYATIKYPR